MADHPHDTQHGDNRGVNQRRKELKAVETRLRTLRSRRASAARDRLVTRQEKLVASAKRALVRQERVAQGKSALPEPTEGKSSSAQQSMRDRIAAERELGLRRGRKKN